MWKCPVCETENTTLLCRSCGFDGSCDFERYPSLAPVPLQTKSVSAHQLLIQRPSTNYLPCTSCGNISFGFRRSDHIPVCLRCSTPFNFAQPAATSSAETKQTRSQPIIASHWIAAGDYHTICINKRKVIQVIGFKGVHSGSLNERHMHGIKAWQNPCEVASNFGCSLMLRLDGTVEGVGNRSDIIKSVQCWDQITAVSVGMFHAVGLHRDGTVVSAGDTTWNQCNITNWKNITAIAAGSRITAGLQKTGWVLVAGDTKHFHVKCWTNISSISCRYSHLVGLCQDGTVVATGANIGGCCDTGSWTEITAIAAGNAHTIGLRKNGTVVAVGGNTHGQCNVSSWRNIVAIAAGSFHTVGLCQDGTLVAVGDNSSGQCNVSGIRLW